MFGYGGWSGEMLGVRCGIVEYIWCVECWSVRYVVRCGV